MESIIPSIGTRGKILDGLSAAADRLKRGMRGMLERKFERILKENLESAAGTERGAVVPGGIPRRPLAGYLPDIPNFRWISSMEKRTTMGAPDGDT
jgi:hypothetical protein